jgi:epoxyqueuosine reductase
MAYLERAVARRLDPRHTLPGAQSVIVASFPYRDDVEFPAAQDAQRGRIARYARGRDYHKAVAPRLKLLADYVAQRGTWRTWWTVDTGPLLERDWAEASGLGWIGKNGLIIDAEIGSYLLLAAIVTDRPFAPDGAAADHCGSCRACLDACPTGALIAPRQMDARRCISYRTIEYRGALGTGADGALHGWIFGCDVCQEVCPFNQRKHRTKPPVWPDLLPRPLPDDLHAIQRMNRAEFLSAFAGTALTRAGNAGLARNAARVEADARATAGSAPPREEDAAHE